MWNLKNVLHAIFQSPDRYARMKFTVSTLAKLEKGEPSNIIRRLLAVAVLGLFHLCTSHGTHRTAWTHGNRQGAKWPPTANAFLTHPSGQRSKQQQRRRRSHPRILFPFPIAPQPFGDIKSPACPLSRSSPSIPPIKPRLFLLCFHPTPASTPPEQGSRYETELASQMALSCMRCPTVAAASVSARRAAGPPAPASAVVSFARCGFGRSAAAARGWRIDAVAPQGGACGFFSPALVPALV
jgi:hypothetical protein